MPNQSMGTIEPMDAQFVFAYRWIRDVEGGYSNDPKDRGKATKWGVTQATYDAYRYRRGMPRRSVLAMEPNECWAIYSAIWEAGRCESMSPRLGVVHFDACVNHGEGNAIRLLQGVVGVPADGIWGPRTESAVNAVSAVGDDRRIADRYIAARRRFYWRICLKRPSQLRFLNGWRNRLRDLARRLEVIP